MAFRPNPPQQRSVQQDEEDLANLSPLERAKEEAASAQAVAAEEQAFYNFFKRHPELDANEANISVMKSFVGDGVHIDLTLLESAYKVMLDQDPKHFPLSRRTAGQEEKKRAELIQSILDEGKDDSPSESIRLGRATTEVLEQKLADIHEERRLRSLPLEELKRLSREDNERRHPKPTTPILPSKFSPEILLAMSAPALRLLASQYSMDRITERINGVN